MRMLLSLLRSIGSNAEVIARGKLEQSGRTSDATQTTEMSGSMTISDFTEFATRLYF